MSEAWRHLLTGAFLALAVVLQWLCCLGMLRMRGVFNRLHFLGPATLLVGPLIAAAVLIDGSSMQASIKAITLAVILLVTNPVTSHALARAARVRKTGSAEATPGEMKRGNLNP
jgi:monovalent cation/proton antiporter MnhG/PhaG subunit